MSLCETVFTGSKYFLKKSGGGHYFWSVKGWSSVSPVPAEIGDRFKKLSDLKDKVESEMNNFIHFGHFDHGGIMMLIEGLNGKDENG